MNLIEGVELKTLVRHYDQRGYFEEVFRIEDIGKFGQLSHSWMFQGVCKAWHLHQKQTDFWTVMGGVLKVALCDRRQGSTYGQIDEFIMGINPETLTIPPGVAHGCLVISGPCHLFYITSEPYNADSPDEGRIAYNSPNIPYNWLQQSEIK